MRSTSDGVIRAIPTALRFTLLDFLLRPWGHWTVRVPILVLATLGLLNREALAMPALWLALAILTGLRIALDWPLPDNHGYLLAYWCLAVFLGLRSVDPAAIVARSARLLVGLVFALAVLWKVLSPDYFDGRFFRVTLLTDPRFEQATRLLGGLSPDDLAYDREILFAPLPEGAELADPPVLFEPTAFRVLAASATWGLFLLEAAVALAFLVPRFGRSRHWILIGFCILVYAVAPVAGFGWVLLAMGLAQTDAADRGLRRAYVTAFLFVLAYGEISIAAIGLRLRPA